MSTFKRCMYLKLTGLKSVYFPKNHVLFSLGGLFFVGPSLVLIHLDTLSLVHTATFVKKGSSSRPRRGHRAHRDTGSFHPPLTACHQSECHRWVERHDCVASRCFSGCVDGYPPGWWPPLQDAAFLAPIFFGGEGKIHLIFFCYKTHLDTAWCRNQDEFHQGILRCESAGVVFVSVVRPEPMIQKSGEKTS